MDEKNRLPQKRHLPKLMACMTKTSLENARNAVLRSIDLLDARMIRRRKWPLCECLVLELKEAGYTESSSYLQDLLYDNGLLVAEDEIGLVVNLKNRDDYLAHICEELQKAEKERDRGHTNKEALFFLGLAKHYAEKEKGILWLAEKFFLASIAVASKYLVDGGRLKGCCKYFYAKFLLDKFPGADTDEPYLILTEIRDAAIGKTWPLLEPEKEGGESPPGSLFCAISELLHRVLLMKAQLIFDKDCAKAERLARLAERRAHDAENKTLLGEAVIQVGICQSMLNNLNNAQKTFQRAMTINKQINNVKGMCETKMHLAAVMQKLNDYEAAARLLTEMGTLAMEHGLTPVLGRALHLLGELHLERERPELGTQHLAEAFSCFMGLNLFGMCCDDEKNIVDTESAEKSRLMMAVSAGQELMASYFKVLKHSYDCQVARMQVIEWKLFKAGWWVQRSHHDLIPCLCRTHNRTGLDVMWATVEKKQREQERIALAEASEFMPWLERAYTIEDLQKLQSLYEVSRQAVAPGK